MINPHFSYTVGFAFSLIIYQLGWSKIYPVLGWPLIVFLLATLAVHFILGMIWKKRLQLNNESENHINPVYVTTFIYLLWLTEFIYGGIPIVEILLQRSFDYRLYGIPSLHVFVVTFASFYTIFLFHQFIVGRKKLHLILFVVNLIAPILIYNRGMMLFIIASVCLIYLNYVKHVSFTLVLTGICGAIVFLYLFGVLGNFRQVAELKRGYTSELFMEVAQPTEGFRKSLVPNEFMWGYIYASSGLANLETNIEIHRGKSQRSVFEFVNSEMIPDFISKRIIKLFHWETVNENRIPGPFNVSTIYSRSYSYLGWFGFVLMAVFILVLPWIYWRMLPITQYTLTGIAILSSMYLLLVFDNTIRFTGFSFQLAYPIIYPIIEKKLLKLK